MTEFFIVTVLMYIFGDEPKTEIILLESDSAKNEIVVSTKAGEVTINKPYQSTKLLSADKKPDEVVALSKKEVTSKYKVVLEDTPKLMQYMIYFGSGSTEVNASAKMELQKAIDYIKAQTNSIITVIGHSDTVGNQDSNMRLSQQRTHAVKEYLESMDLNIKELSTEYYGENTPLVKTKDGVSNAKNRRVEIFIR